MNLEPDMTCPYLLHTQFLILQQKKHLKTIKSIDSTKLNFTASSIFGDFPFPFYVIVTFLNPLKRSENFWFCYTNLTTNWVYRYVNEGLLISLADT